jgi:Holliday junction DNA helicase RuvA
MIARLVGRLARKSPDALIVDVHGVGYRVMVSLNAFSALPAEGEPVELSIQTQMRENAIDLFGFLDEQEQALFGGLVGVSGVGPRMALNILSGMPTAHLVQALADGDVAKLVAMPGVGKKTADRLVVELRDRVRLICGKPADRPRAQDGLENEAVSALVNLGYRQPEAERTVRQAIEVEKGDLAAVIRAALRQLSGGSKS